MVDSPLSAMPERIQEVLFELEPKPLSPPPPSSAAAAGGVQADDRARRGAPPNGPDMRYDPLSPCLDGNVNELCRSIVLNAPDSTIPFHRAASTNRSHLIERISLGVGSIRFNGSLDSVLEIFYYNQGSIMTGGSGDSPSWMSSRATEVETLSGHPVI
jgi:hypothetical protein